MNTIDNVLKSGTSALNSLSNIGTADQSSVINGVKTFVNARISHLEPIAAEYDKVFTALDSMPEDSNVLDLSDVDLQALSDEYVVDSEGIIHQISPSDTELRIYTGDEYLLVGTRDANDPTGVYHILDDDAKFCATTFVDACSDVLDTSSAYLEYVSNISDATYENSSYLAAIIQDGMNSSIVEVRSLASDLAKYSADAVPTALTSYLKSGLSGIAESGTLDSDAAQDWHFSLSDYHATSTLNILASGWSILESGLGIIASVCMMSGKVILGGLLLGAQMISQAVSKVKNAVSEYTSFSLGTGTSQEYANGSLLTLDGDFSFRAELNQPGLSLITPWGTIYVEQPAGVNDGQLHTFHAVKMLLKPNATLVTYGPIISRDLIGGVIEHISTHMEDHYDYNSQTKILDYRLVNDYANIFDVPDLSTDYAKCQFYSQPVVNMSCLCFWLASTIFDYGVVFGHGGVGLDSWGFNFPEYREAISDSLCTQLTIPANIGSFSDSMEGCLKKSVYNLVLDPPANLVTDSWLNYQTNYRAKRAWDNVRHFLSFEADINSAFDSFLKNQGVITYTSGLTRSISCEVGNFSASQLVWHFFNCLFDDFASAYLGVRSFSFPGSAADLFSMGCEAFINRLMQNASGKNSPLMIEFIRSDDQYKISDYEFIYSENCVLNSNPHLTSDPWLMPPKYSKSSIIKTAAFIAIGATVAVGLMYLLKRRARKRRMTKAVQAEAELDAAMKTYQADPTKANAKELFKKSRRYSRKARRAGYSSNTVGTFDCYNRSSAEATASALDSFSSLSPTEANNDACYDIISLIKS